MHQITPDIGSRIRQAREQRGLTIRDIANTTKISPTALNAIERNQFARLPGGVFRRAYVRAVATEVGLDADELTREYRATFEVEEAAEPPQRRMTQWFNRVRSYNRWPGVLLMVGILVGGSMMLRRAEVAHQPQDERLMLGAAEPDGPEDAAFAANVAVSQAASPSLRLQIRLNGACWVSAQADGTRVVYRLMQPGERTLVEAHSLITLRVGDAGAVAYSINGATGRPLGRRGEAVTVRITRENLEGLFAEPASKNPLESAATRNQVL